MAGRDKRGRFRKKSGGGGGAKVIRLSPAKPANTTIRVSAPRSPAKRRRKGGGGGHRRRSSGGLLGGLGGRVGSRTAILVGSAVLGYAQQKGWLQKLPVVGKSGPITSFGILGWGAEEVLHMKLPDIVHNAVTAALAISSFNVGLTVGTTGGVQLVGDAPGGAVFFD